MNTVNRKYHAANKLKELYRLSWRYFRKDFVLLYFAVFIICAAFFQLRSETKPWVDGSPIEYFTGGLLWISSLICLLMAKTKLIGSWRSWFWLAASVGLALLAIDEFFAFHERTKMLVGDDDHIKVLQWFFAGGVLYIIDRFESLSVNTKIAFIIGFAIHGLYILSDIGDGDYFRILFLPKSHLRWAEEFLELFALTAYCIGFIYLYKNTLKASIMRDQ